MKENIYKTPLGDIHYWINVIDQEKTTLVFLPGLTADHRLFDKQIAYFEYKVNVFVWDAPGHASSWPFKLEFDLMDKAKWLDEILELENIKYPVIVGQSMGGYVGQAYAGHGMKILAEAMERDLPYKIECTALLICGEKDYAGSCIRYNKAWHKNTNIPIAWIKDAGHNSNTDKPEVINELIEKIENQISNI